MISILIANALSLLPLVKMADPLGISASIIAILHLSRSLTGYLNEVKDAPKERLRLRDETTSACYPLFTLKERLSSGQDLRSVQLLGGPSGSLAQFQRLLEEIQSILAPGKSRVQRIGKAVRWPFKNEEIIELFGTLQRHKLLFNFALQDDIVSLSQAIKADTSVLPVLTEGIAEIKDRVESLQLVGAEPESRQVVGWLSPLNFFPTQDDLFDRREEGTGRWLLDSPEFNAWFQSAGGRLWCPGLRMMPAVAAACILQVKHIAKTTKQRELSGKMTRPSLTSIRSSIAVDRIRGLQRSLPETRIGVACIYCMQKERATQTPINLLASIWRQLLPDAAVVSRRIQSLYREHIDKDTHPDLKTISEIVKEEAERYEKVYVLVDALDECSDDYSREILCQQLHLLRPKVNLLVTSRHSDNIAHLLVEAHILEICASPADIRAYIEGRMSRDRRLSKYVHNDASLADDILAHVHKMADQMFLLAQLHMNSLVSKTSQKNLRRALDTLPETLDATYEEAMIRIEEQVDDYKQLAERILAWTSHAVRPLSVNELQAALAVEPNTAQFDVANAQDEELLTTVCAGLVVIDQQSNVIRLCHYTAEQFLKRVRSEKFPTAQVDIAGACLTYLLYDDFRTGAAQIEPEAVFRVKDNPLLQYAALHWGWHVKGDPEMILSALVLRFLATKSHLANCVQSAYFAEHWFRGYSALYPKHITGLHIAAQFGLESTVKVLLAQGSDLAASDFEGEDALQKACKGGHEAVVQLLLHNGADPTIKDRRGLTTLHKAAMSGKPSVVILLMETGAAISSRGSDGKTPLHVAAEFGKEEIVKFFLAKGADVKAESVLFGNDFEHKFHAGRTPLHWAAANGYHSLVRLLIEHGADVNSLNTTFRTPLQEAIMWGHISCIEVLLELGASFETRDKEGWMPLHEAAWRSPGRVTQLLLQCGADFEALAAVPQTSVPEPMTEKDQVLRGRNTPIHLAVCAYNLEAFELLKARGANLKSSDVNGMLPIYMAAVVGSADVIEVLVGGDCGINVQDTIFGETALHQAAHRGFDSCVKLLMENGAATDIRNHRGQSVYDKLGEQV